jgi:ankyrin repeat protein
VDLKKIILSLSRIRKNSNDHFAVITGKEFALRELIAGGISPNTAYGGVSLLMEAARDERLGIMRLLIASGADLNYQHRMAMGSQKWRSDAATYALRAGKYHAARLLFSAGYTLPKSGQGRTMELFFAAIAGGSAQAVRYMLDHFTLIDTVNADGETPLTFAVQTETTDHVISELLLRGADPCKRNKAGQSVEELLAEVNKGKKSYDARFASVSDRLICQQQKR